MNLCSPFPLWSGWLRLKRGMPIYEACSKSGTDRIFDLFRPKLTAGCQLDMVSPSFSLIAFSEILHEMVVLLKCRLLLQSASMELSILGSVANRTVRNCLQEMDCQPLGAIASEQSLM